MTPEVCQRCGTVVSRLISGVCEACDQELRRNADADPVTPHLGPEDLEGDHEA